MSEIPPPSSVRVLLVDDEPNTVESYSRYLEFCGYNVSTANDGVEALEAIKRDKPDIVFLDIKMPKMDGWETCKRIKEDPSICGTPIIFLTAFDQVQDHERARRLCVQGYITKPCEPAQLVRYIHSCVV